MSIFRSNSVAGYESVVVSRGPVATVTKQVRVSSSPEKRGRFSVRMTSRYSSHCAVCGAENVPGHARWLHSVEAAGRTFVGGTACCEDCYWTLRERMAYEIFSADVIVYDSFRYRGKQKAPLRLDRDLCTGDFLNPDSARCELLLQAAERGCTYVIKEKVHHQWVVEPDGRNVKLYWATGKV